MAYLFTQQEAARYLAMTSCCVFLPHLSTYTSSGGHAAPTKWGMWIQYAIEQGGWNLKQTNKQTKGDGWCSKLLSRDLILFSFSCLPVVLKDLGPHVWIFLHEKQLRNSRLLRYELSPWESWSEQLSYNVILHVVYGHDITIWTDFGNYFSTSLKLLSSKRYSRYLKGIK